MQFCNCSVIMIWRTPFITVYIKQDWFLEVWIDIFRDTGNIRKTLSRTARFYLCNSLPMHVQSSAFHKQPEHGDVQNAAAIHLAVWCLYSHMTTHWFYFYLHADIYVKKSIRQTVLISIDWQSDNWILFTFQSDWQLDT